MIANRAKLNLAMARACMDPKDVAKAADMSLQTVNRVLLCRGSRPATIGRIAKVLGVDPEEILECLDDRKSVIAPAVRDSA